MRTVNHSNDPILRSLIQATMAGSHIVWKGQRTLITGVDDKKDKTYVTDVDRASEAAALPFLLSTGLGIVQEEAGFTGPDTEEKIFYDGVDGTRPLLLGLCTSTVITATYSSTSEEVTRCVVGEPATGRIWFAGRAEGAWVGYHEQWRDDTENVDQMMAKARRCYVWNEVNFPGKATYFLDVTPTFIVPKNYERPITSEGLGQLLYNLTAVEQLDNSLPGSNGLNHALIANGGFGAKAAVTTALGGPWDAAPVFLVYKAGGAVLGFKNGVAVKGLSVMKGDVFISANSQTSASKFARMVLKSFYPE